MRFRTSLALAALVAAAGLVAGCISPASEVLVVIGTDIDPTVPLTITATVSRMEDGAADGIVHAWTRAAPDADVDAGIALPASFAVRPSTSSPTSPLTLEVEANAGGVSIRRRAAFVVPIHRTTVLRIFLTSRCVQETTGCTSPGPCTIESRCEEQGQTCGNDGTCVDVPVDTTGDLDGSFGDLPAPVSCGLYHEACCVVGVACDSPLTCVSGRCQRCTDLAEVCCNGGDLLPDGTSCGTAPDRCHDAPMCNAGVCEPAAPRANGTVCAATTNPCKVSGTCMNGACGAITDAPNGTQCSTPTNPCHTPATCSGGACGSEGVRPNGTKWGSSTLDRCCGGNAVRTDTNSNCGVCGLRCTSGSCTSYNGRYYCPCSLNSQCFSSCCRTQSPGSNLCVPGVCSTGACANDCPGGATCFDANFAPNYCYYP